MSRLGKGFTSIDELEAVLDNIPDHIFIFDEDGYCVRIFDSKEDPFAISTDNYIGKHMNQLYGKELAKCFLHCTQSALGQESTLFVSYSFTFNEIIIFPEHLRTNERLWFEGRIKVLPFQFEGKRLLMWSARNITERRLLEEQVKQLVNRDELTQVFNRRALINKLTECFEQYKRYGNREKLGVLMFDIDDFKLINDQYGHVVGDQILRHLTMVCSQNLRITDFLGRIGGEEFAVIMPHTDMHLSYQIAERLRVCVQQDPAVYKGTELPISISIGIAEFDSNDEDISDVLARADRAMYESKKRGKNQVTPYGIF